MSILLQTKQRRLIKKESLPRHQADDNHVNAFFTMVQ
jgi:hypothetical protein